jgi:DNA-binding transcriptional MerR regulator
MADYALQQLADLAGVTPRTVRYYIAQGLLASPGAGSGARYSDDHLERLRLIRRLQRDHLPLAEIRAQLNRGSATDYIRSVLNEPASSAPAPVAMTRAAFASTPAWLPAPRARPTEPLPPQPDRSQWDRVALTPNVELHIRRPLTRDQNRRVDRLIALARELLLEDQP